jgi:hypothetical protein
MTTTTIPAPLPILVLVLVPNHVLQRVKHVPVKATTKIKLKMRTHARRESEKNESLICMIHWLMYSVSRLLHAVTNSKFTNCLFIFSLLCSPKPTLSLTSAQTLEPFRKFGRHSFRITSPYIDFFSILRYGLEIDGKVPPLEDEAAAWLPLTDEDEIA